MMKLFIAITFIPIIIFAKVQNTSENSMNIKNQKHRISTFKIESKEYPNLAKIKMSEAILIAETKTVGKLIESSLESENNFLIYNITFSKPDRSISVIKIDAGSGTVLNVQNQTNTEL